MEHRVPGREEIFRMIKGVTSHGEADAEGNKMEKRFTVEAIEALPEGERAELIDGRLYMMAAPTLTHQDILSWLNMRIRQHITGKQGGCKVIPAPFAVYIQNDDRNYVEPDISVVCDRSKLDEKGCHGAPDWVVEIVSPSSRAMDYIMKCTLYETAGVRVYWIVDPKDKCVIVYDFEQGVSERHTFSERVKVSIYEDFFLDFSEVA